MDPDELARAARDLGFPSTTASTVDDALDLALQEAGEDTLVFVTGSLYLVGAARSHLLGSTP
jgi:folylpolyglutamate synthase/dihydropteroate synthase